MIKLAQYQSASGKMVQAGKIKTISPPGVIDAAKWVVQAANADTAPQKHSEFKIDGTCFLKGIAIPGDYLVIYPNGDVSWTERVEFENAYKKIEER